MSIDPTLGHVSLDGVTFSTDPRTYEPLNWKKRATVIRGIGGAVTIQDFGTFAKDNTLRLESAGQYVDQAFVTAMHSRFRTRGATYTLLDWLNNEFVVFITEFVPKPTFIGAGADLLYEYSMTLQVVTMPALFSTTYTGS